ncbi:hypothetical protein BN2364_1080 [Alloalcanivorax xenomutans]|uniref:hypothetical protein n=1 Tax=Alloalcanivorax xenomutans TaxID=1094342 RepID=UPI0006D5C069|nr:hypothetical protein [Alloalcanivorax xenomutans]CUR45521.1 hypothetical protein BN2364_1080 [Alloalcanivorax xenomutans]
MLINDRELWYWADLFVDLGLRRYMRFDTFITNPRGHLRRICEGEHRPLLTRQRDVRDRLDKACQAFEAELERWEGALAEHRRIENGHILETMKHHRHPR